MSFTEKKTQFSLFENTESNEQDKLSKKRSGLFLEKIINRAGSGIIKINKKVFAAAAAVILAAVILISASVASSDSAQISLYYAPERNGAVVFADNELSDSFIPAGSISVVKYSQAKNSCCVLAADSGGYSLYYVSENKCDVISNSATNRFVISYSGSDVVFYENSGILKKYSAKNGQITDIVSGSSRFAVSPDGKNIIYNIVDENGAKLYLYSDMQSRYLCEGHLPVAVSDDIKYIYTLSSDDSSLCILDGSGAIRSKLGTGIAAKEIIFSSDLMSVVFTDGNYTYMSVEGKSRIRLSEGQIFPYDENDVKIGCDSDNISHIYEKDSLCGMFYFAKTDDGLKAFYYIDKNAARTDIDSEIKAASYTDKNELICLRSDGQICLFNGKTSSILISGVSDMRCTADGKYIYYINDSSELFAYKNGESVKLASGVSKIYMTNKNNLLFIMSGGDLYSAYKMRYGDKIDTDVYGCAVSQNCAFYYKNYSLQTGYFDIYSSDGGTDFAKKAEKISWIM